MLDAVFKALADPTRRKILSLLREKPLNAGEIAAHFEISKPSISHHLNQLKDAGLIYGERDGTTITYHLNLTVFEELISSIADLWKRGNHVR
ncbi:MAG TPA: autorepressor SdpR family transcription factor [Chroococcales cyanobacterium]|jgi:DNA-binding transcriptional ArsR family regulator